MMEELRLAVTCPKCTHPPRLRVFPLTLARYRNAPPGELVVSYQCHWHGCGHVYAIRAEHIVHAKPVEIRKAA